MDKVLLAVEKAKDHLPEGTGEKCSVTGLGPQAPPKGEDADRPLRDAAFPPGGGSLLGEHLRPDRVAGDRALLPSGPGLVKLVEQLVVDPGRLKELGENAKKLAKPRAVEEIAAQLLALAGEGKEK